MFIVAGGIEATDAVRDILRRPGLFPDDYDSRVLVVHSDAPEALARLAAVRNLTAPSG
jgi:hypothetical protein